MIPRVLLLMRLVARAVASRLTGRRPAPSSPFAAAPAGPPCVVSIESFLDEIVRRGVAESKIAYSRPRQEALLAGALEGFEACRGAAPERLKDLLIAAEAEVSRLAAAGAAKDAYWRAVARLRQIEWCCNCVSALLHGTGREIIPPTARGMCQALTVVAALRGAGEGASP